MSGLKAIEYSNMEKKVRVRFAPSPTGGLHLGGVRTALFNYLFAKQHNGTFVLRIEDTDQTRFVEGAEQYIMDCLKWCGLTPDESPENPGEFGPYRQSERKPSYLQYAKQLIEAGHAYYAFDTPEELDAIRKVEPNFVYNQKSRLKMRNSLTMSAAEVSEWLSEGKPYVVRILIPEHEQVEFNDLIRGEVKFETNIVDDKVLLKADGMPTYHLAVVVDDYAMKISHVFRGEEWLPSAPIHILLWKYLGWENEIPQWAHLPLILKPDGNGKLSKRDGDRLGFPVFAMNWEDPSSGSLTTGFKEMGFLPEAFVNMLAMLGWNAGTEQEIFNLDELVQNFDIERVSKAGAKFDFEKAKWYNHQWIQKTDVEELFELVNHQLKEKGITESKSKIITVINLIKDRCNLLPDFIKQSHFFFVTPSNIDFSAISGKWDINKTNFYKQFIDEVNKELTSLEYENLFKDLALKQSLKTGELMLPLRIMLVGGKFGPGVFDIASVIGAEELKKRINLALEHLN